MAADAPFYAGQCDDDFFRRSNSFSQGRGIAPGETARTVLSTDLAFCMARRSAGWAQISWGRFFTVVGVLPADHALSSVRCLAEVSSRCPRR